MVGASGFEPTDLLVPSHGSKKSKLLNWLKCPCAALLIKCATSCDTTVCPVAMRRRTGCSYSTLSGKPALQCYIVTKFGRGSAPEIPDLSVGRIVIEDGRAVI